MKKIQLVIKILAVALVVAIAFVGIYVQKQNRMENVVKDYTLGMDLEGARVIELKVSDEKKEITRDKDGMKKIKEFKEFVSGLIFQGNILNGKIEKESNITMKNWNMRRGI